jgi:hypothetical protein
VTALTVTVSSPAGCHPVYRKYKFIEFIIRPLRVQVLSGATRLGHRNKQGTGTAREILTAVDKSLTICGLLIQETKLIQAL